MALAFACCVSSCSDFLEEENKTGATAELEYATVSGIDGLMGSAYSFYAFGQVSLLPWR